MRDIVPLTLGAAASGLLYREHKIRARAERMSAATLETLLNAIEANDAETGAHVKRVTAYAIILGEAAGFNDHTLRSIERVALFHDVGKAVSNSNHPAMSAEMVRPWLSEDAYWLIKNHQDFQGIHYFARMGLDPNMRIKHKDHPCYALAEQFVDEWDQEAFDPDYDTFPLEHFEDLVRTTFSRAPRRPVT